MDFQFSIVIICVIIPVLYYSGKQQITNQIQLREDEKRMQEELKEMEKQQLRDKQEKMNLEDLKVADHKH